MKTKQMDFYSLVKDILHPMKSFVSLAWLTERCFGHIHEGVNYSESDWVSDLMWTWILESLEELYLAGAVW